jgi:RHS repeat-associated protein
MTDNNGLIRHSQTAYYARKGNLRQWLCNLALIALTCFVMATSAAAQNIQFTQGNVGSGLDNTLQIALRAYPGRGAASLPVTLSYSSQVWRINHLKTVNNGTYLPITEAIFAEHSTAGWSSSLDIPKVEWPKNEDTYYYTGKAFCQVCGSNFRQFRVARVYIHMPDGSKHELRKGDQPYEGPIQQYGTFYAVDSSRLRYDSFSETTGILYFPDGTRYKLNGSTAQYIDRNGNTLNYDSKTRQWSDTLGRVLGIPLPAIPEARDYPYSLPGIDGQITYTFRWKELRYALTPDTVTGLLPQTKPIANEYLPYPNQPPTAPSGGNYPQFVQTSWGQERPSLFISGSDDMDEGYTTIVGHNQNGGELFNPVVLAEIILPSGLSYKFSYNINGEIDKVTYPTGAFDRYQFAEIPPIGDVKPPYTQANRGVTSRQLSANGTGNDIATWTYSTTGALVTATAPDGTRTETYKKNFPTPGHGSTHGGIVKYWPFGFEDARQGMAYEERIYAPGTNGAMLRRQLTDWAQTANIVQPSIPALDNTTKTAYRNARSIKAVSLILDTGGDALAKTLTYGYDTTYQLSTGLDLTVSTESFFASVDQTTAQTGAIETVPSGTLASSAETIFLSDPAYRDDRNILGLPTSVVLKDPTGQVVSKTESFYDEGAYALLTYGDLAALDWTDPATTARANVTTVRRYFDIGANLYLETHAQYDQCGNVRNTWNERGILSQFDYSADYKHAYATQATTAVPDPSGAHGSNVAFTSSTTFDYTTGLALTILDANGQTTTFSYKNDQNVTDPSNRLRKVTRPDGGWTKYEFNEVVGDIFSYTQTKQDDAHISKAYQYVDPLGRVSRSFVSEDATNYIASDTLYDNLGRVSKTSNPYRTTQRDGIAAESHTGNWTTAHYDALSRGDSVTLPDGSIVQTSYEGIYTTVTDQAGKKRRQKADALGRVVRIDEPDANGSLGAVDAPTQATYYDYSTQGNLVHITQGTGATVQNRYFKYDALGRLTYERQVEEAGTFSVFDSLTGNSAWSRKLIYDQTINGVSYSGLLTNAYDARNINTQFQYDGFNRVWQIAYSDGTPTVTNNYDQARTGYFNKGHLTAELTAAAGSVPATAQVYNSDLMGRPANNQQVVGDQTYSLSYAYNVGGALTSETYPSGRVVSYAFDDAARLSQVSSGSKVYANQFDYSAPQGLLKSLTLGNGAVESFDYNSRMQLKSIDLVKTGTVLQHYDYKFGVYDPGTNSVDETKNNGQIARIEGTIATQKQWQQNFTYDPIGRLSSARELRGDNNQQSYLVNYDYDLFGNRYQKQSRNAGNPFSQIWTEDADINQLTNRLANSVSYDNAGNVLTDQKYRQLKFQYDANNRQRQSSSLNDTGVVVSVYDAGGQRVGMQVGGALTNVLVYDAMGQLVAEYGSASSSNGTQYVMADHQGSTRAVLNTAGTVVSRHDYLPFGEELSAGVGLRSSSQGYNVADSVRQKYAGMETDDASGMAHTLWRQYDSLSGRWTAPDPYGGSMTVADPQSFNRYCYVLNNPTNTTDPSGMIPYNGADQSWSDMPNGFWGSGYLGGNGWGNNPSPGRDIVNANFHSNVRLTVSVRLKVSFRSIQYNDGSDDDFSEHTYSWWEKVWTFDPIDLHTTRFPGYPRDPDGDSFLERYVREPVRSALQVANWASQGFRNVGYALLPDYAYVNGGVPLLGSGSLSYSKDRHLFFSFAGPTAGAKNLKLGGGGGVAYFATIKMKPEDRDTAIQGPGLNVTTGPVGGYFTTSGPPAITLGGPFNLGVNGSQTKRIY